MSERLPVQSTTARVVSIQSRYILSTTSDVRCFEVEVLRQAIPELRSGAWELESCGVSRVHAHTGKRIVFGWILYRDRSDGQLKTAELVAKVYRRGRESSSLTALRKLWDAGFQPPAPCRVPRPYGASPRIRVLYQEHAPGVTWARLVSRERQALSSGSTRAAGWLVSLQESQVEADVEAPSWSAAAARMEVAELAASFPPWRSCLVPLGRWLVERLESPHGRPLPSHGDFEPENFLLAPGSTTALRLERFALREPAFDVGFAIGQLLVLSSMKCGDLAPGAAAALAFWEEYRKSGGATWPRVCVHVARTLLHQLHYERCTLRNDHLELQRRRPWLTVMAMAMDGSDPVFLERFVLDRRGPPAGRS